MHTFKLENGQMLEIENDGDVTSVGFSSGGSSQQQSQSRGFTTGKWTQAPLLFRKDNDLILQFFTENGEGFLGIAESHVTTLEKPDLSPAEKLSLVEGPGSPKMKPMKPMEPMRPMEPMKPMAPMKPM